jgi:hypothetical protein
MKEYTCAICGKPVLGYMYDEGMAYMHKGYIRSDHEATPKKEEPTVAPPSEGEQRAIWGDR